MRDQDQLQQLVLYDLFFGYVRSGHGASLDEIVDRHPDQMRHFSLSKDAVKQLLQQLVTEGKLFVTEEGIYKLDPGAYAFPGFVIDFYQSRQQDKEKSRKETMLKVLPIVVSVVFGLSTVFFSIWNIKNGKTLKTLEARVDSLEKVVRHGPNAR